MKKTLLVLFALMLVVRLTSCGEAKEIGSYEIESMTSDGETMSLQDLKDLYAKYDMPFTENDFGLTLNKDGTGKMSVMGETSDIKWDAKAKTMSLNGDTVNYTFKDNKITVGEKDDVLVFVKKN